MNPIEMVRSILGENLTEEEADSILWERTSFPFIPSGRDPEEWMRGQLETLKREGDDASDC